jgi:hypothetical protein
MTASRKRISAGVRLVVVLLDRMKTKFLTLGARPGVMVIIGGVSPVC